MAIHYTDVRLHRLYPVRQSRNPRLLQKLQISYFIGIYQNLNHDIRVSKIIYTSRLRVEISKGSPISSPADVKILQSINYIIKFITRR